MKKTEVIFEYRGYKIVTATPLTRFLFGNSRTRYFLLEDKNFFSIGCFSGICGAVGALLDRVPSFDHPDVCSFFSEDFPVRSDHLLSFARLGDYLDDLS